MSEAVFQYIHRGDSPPGITFYEWLQLSEQQERRKVMMRAMISMNTVLGSLAALHGLYSWSQTRSVCDVGSGMGGFSRSLLEISPNVHVAQFDLPKTIAIAKQHWKNDFADRVTFVSGDFFEEIPAKNCDIYYLRNILHNWTDEKAVKILESVRQAMGSHSRVLVHDHVLRHMSPMTGSDADGLDTAPKPLLPNYGAGQIRVYHQDLTMMMMYNTRERTTTEIINLGKRARLCVFKIFDLAEMCLVEFGVAEE
ncbi:hypothetical protein GALMADRAFT_142824 [Galerina marginata CBS 339.88]|uniref:O-methyltransferase C-terminal domain-containing protein n=1 Tax=Galerina marginata (strain CBS 339.88) TaxID=685588 RepID=A0A067SR68_GALM3|nr:hypothetical protein GALMADRAFT_142824 [Galerina marginata CBS 339.88]